MTRPSTRPRRIAIVGAGFSGAVTAVQLLRHAPAEGLQVVLINESGRMARGLAYGTSSREHVLNVPAANMSALAQDAEDFLRYCRWSDPQVEPTSFVSRRLYGAYLDALLSAAELTAAPAIALERIVGRVIGLDIDADAGVAIRLAQGGLIAADHVVLAFGHFAPLDPLPPAAIAAAGARYIRDPWARGALQGIGANDDVLLVGAGLTAVDVALALARDARRGRLISISRRGLAPNPHRRSGAAPGALDAGALVAAMGDSLRQQWRVLRRDIAARIANGEDWRDVIGALRAHTPALWQRLSAVDRARFLRHARPHWEVLRHRCAPAAHEAYQGLVEQGALDVRAARMVSVEPGDAGLVVQLQRRGAAGTERLTVQHIVNCTGPSSDLRRCPSPLVRDLLEAGWICPDPLGLGLQVDPHYAVVGRDGVASPRLSYIGPLLKARDWEATAVPELRTHAWQLAQRLLGL
ncbi:FAD/NAD(P)-binding protein [Aquincola sp. S2]|uniref:FAD/NAD(P)-binding protein n=1 Tax=Pseudaquabacterium terrae TaxID=2732868 RepID=A0ABX2EV40_9BURK|nr:FAD/NAD(P)-binding protein [Aquabacterium terrae]NRF72355.1 FAD/NAD(P)-binding protein [Aquabacterium terrae]